ncbi:zinc ribbon domain-containing protein [Halorubrum sp. CBA1125]|uniref:zinc ribbon domain-containing protein n=1 Tax=Halorubrum sp. CBA1125 TaxID=2668072 RepID=UPI0012E865B0|nr:zinc ribbon domain-containing protein [Halorubrum sp. CBA1125]MUW14814.1 zinc ribbon domain-containing protein [Halorubrum sp. CBA1125]
MDTMSVLQTVKEAVGLDNHDPAFRCEECGNEFEYSDPDSYWFSCPECGNDDEDAFTSLS